MHFVARDGWLRRQGYGYGVVFFDASQRSEHERARIDVIAKA